MEVQNTVVTAFDVFRALPQANRNVQKILAALNENTGLEFVDQPLSDVIEYLKERHEIDIVLDQEALTKAGIGSDALITRNIKGISLKSALELLLGELDLTCYAEGDRLVVRPIK